MRSLIKAKTSGCDAAWAAPVDPELLGSNAVFSDAKTEACCSWTGHPNFSAGPTLEGDEVRMPILDSLKHQSLGATVGPRELLYGGWPRAHH